MNAKQFLIKLIVMVIFSSVVLSVGFEKILYTLGETRKTEEIILEQAKNSALYGPLFSTPDILFKIKSANFIGPDIISFGFSRILTLNYPIKSFYNLGVASQNNHIFLDVKNYLNLATKWPKEIILQLDPWFFDGSTEANQILIRDISLSQKYFDPILNRLRIYNELLFSLNTYLSELKNRDDRLIGLMAKKFKSGYLPNGSFKYPDNNWARLPNENEIKSLIESNNNYFTSNPFLSKEILELFRECLEEILNKNIKLYIVFPPLNPTLYKALKNYPKILEFYKKIETEICKPLNLTTNGKCLFLVNPDTMEIGEDSFLDILHIKEDDWNKIINLIFRDT